MSLVDSQKPEGNRIQECRSCGKNGLLELVNLGDIHLSGHFVEFDQSIGYGELALLGCFDGEGCGLVQLSTSYDQSMLYGSNYGYRSGLNPSMSDHLAQKVSKIMSTWNPNSDDLIIDIGSNDGTTLAHYPASFSQLNGVDPTAKKFSRFYAPHIKYFPSFFSEGLVASLGWAGKAKVVTSFSMFYDLPSPLAFMRDVRNVLKEDGVWISEQSYLGAMLEAKSFDTICHEHLEYYSLAIIIKMAEEAGLKVIDCEFNDVNGGSFSFTAMRASSPVQVGDSVLAALEFEKSLGLEDPKTFAKFQRDIDIQVRNLRELLEQLKVEGQRVAALGASTKGNVLLEYAKVDRSLIAAIGDVNPDKWGKVTPGTKIPIKDEESLLADGYDYYVVLPWHFREFFLDKFTGSGLRLIFPLPQVSLVEC